MRPSLHTFVTVVGVAVAGGLNPTVAHQFAQEPPTYRFEVVSVKPSSSTMPAPFYVVNNTKGRFEAEHATLRQLIVSAYDLNDGEVAGGPSWTNMDRYDISAKVDDAVAAPPATNTRHLMLRQLLVDRFALSMHTEPHEADVYELGFARTDRKLGPDLKPSSVTCSADKPAQFLTSTEAVECGPGFRPGMLSGRGITIDQIIPVLARELRQPVLNKTALDGKYDVTLQWTPQWVRDLVSRFGTPPGGNDRLIDPDGPSLFEVMEKRLGLKLRTAKASRPMWIIDHAEKPAPN